ncbi:MAG: histidine kinase N-terminal 7TM domain-containing protein [Rhodothermales bacterium]
MTWTYTGYVWLFLMSAVVSILLLRYAWLRRDVRAARPFIALTVIAAFWSLVSSLQVLAVGLAAKVFFAEIRYLATTTIPVAWITFALAYTGRRQVLTFRTLAGLLVIPGLTLLLVATNAHHGLMFNATTLSTAGPFESVAQVYGSWFWIHVGYSYVLLLIGALLLILQRINGPRLYRKQTTFMLAGMAAPLLVNALFLTAPDRFAHIDLTPVAFSISGLLFAWGLFRLHLLDLMPVSRSAIVEHIPDAVIVLDVRDRVVDLNPEARRIFGTTAAEAVGEPITALSHDLNIRPPDERESQSMSQEVTLHVEGRPCHFEWRNSPLTNRRGSPSGRLIVLRNITERKQVEVALIKAKEKAEEMARLKSSFLANMSHEIRTPLTSIIGFADILSEDLDPERRDLVTRIGKAGTRLLSTLNSVLDYARLEAGKLDVSSVVLDVIEVARETVAVFLPQTQARGLILELDARVEVAHARLDRALVIRILNNLVENALKFTEKGRVVLEVDADASHVFLTVRDTGCGISDAFLPSIFEEFRQESTGLARSHEGSGLGLKITKRLVELMEGTIDVESTKGEGSVFRVSFPRHLPSREAPLRGPQSPFQQRPADPNRTGTGIA